MLAAYKKQQLNCTFIGFTYLLQPAQDVASKRSDLKNTSPLTSRGGMTTTHLYFKFMTVTISQTFASPHIQETSQVTPNPQQIKRKNNTLPGCHFM